MSHYFVEVGEKEYEASLDEHGSISLEGVATPFEIRQAGPSTYSILVGGRSVTILASGGPAEFQFLVNGKQCSLRVASERERLLTVVAGKQVTGKKLLEIRAPMPALVATIEVEIGDEVRPGQGLVVLEAMKMENEIKSHQQGRVRQIFVRQHQSVEKGELLLLLE